MLAEDFVLEHFREAQNGVERRAQFVAHRGEKARLGQIALLGPATAFVGDGFLALKLGKDRVFFRAQRQHADNAAIEPIGDQPEQQLRPQGDQRHDRRHIAAHLPVAQQDGNCDRHRARQHRQRQVAGHHGAHRQQHQPGGQRETP
jgi:hypothetical protein